MTPFAQAHDRISLIAKLDEYSVPLSLAHSSTLSNLLLKMLCTFVLTNSPYPMLITLNFQVHRMKILGTKFDLIKYISC